jgi:hypothetical protein
VILSQFLVLARQLPGCLEELRNATKIFSQDKRIPGPDMNTGPQKTEQVANYLAMTQGLNFSYEKISEINMSCLLLSLKANYS